MKRERVAVVGGSGFVGRNLLQRLQELEVVACSLDVTPLPQSLLAQSSYIKVDITDIQQVKEAIDTFKPTCVVHLAGWGMSGSAMLSTRCHIINTMGTKNVISACQSQSSVKSIIYLSTYNVVFGGQEILGGDEEMPYFSGIHPDQYAPSKTEAEKAILEANTLQLSTCVLRPAAIYGPGEERHFPRIIEVIDRYILTNIIRTAVAHVFISFAFFVICISGLFLFRIGNAMVDWVHVTNLVQSIELSILKLTGTSPRTDNGVAGQTFFIADGTPVRNFDFFLPLCEARGVRAPPFYLPVIVGLWLASICEGLFYITSYAFGTVHAWEPFLTTPEVYKVGMSHYFSIRKAKQTLGYNPAYTSTAGSQEMANYYRTNLAGSKNYFQIVHPIVAVLIMLGMAMLTYIALIDESTVISYSILNDLKSLGYYLFRSKFGLQVVLSMAHIVHLFETWKAISICNEIGVRRNLKLCWAVQTFMFGIGSLSMLLSRRKFMKLKQKEH